MARNRFALRVGNRMREAREETGMEQQDVADWV